MKWLQSYLVQPYRYFRHLFECHTWSWCCNLTCEMVNPIKSIVNILSNCGNFDLSILPEILRSQIYNLSEPNSIAINDRQNGWFWLAVKRVVPLQMNTQMTRCELWILEFLEFRSSVFSMLNFISRYVCKKVRKYVIIYV